MPEPAVTRLMKENIGFKLLMSGLSEVKQTIPVYHSYDKPDLVKIKLLATIDQNQTDIDTEVEVNEILCPALKKIL